MEHFLNIIIFLTLLIFNENIEAKQHYSDNWGSEIIQGTIHLRRRQIFTIFDPYPPTIGIPAKFL